MTYSNYPIYTPNAIHEDLCFLISSFFYDTRKKKGYTLIEVSKKTGLRIKDIDNLETAAGIYDFAIICKLIEFYQEKIPLEPGCFPELPEEIAKICLK